MLNITIKQKTAVKYRRLVIYSSHLIGCQSVRDKEGKKQPEPVSI